MSNVIFWRDDIGIDKVDDNCFHCQIVDELGATVAFSVGENADDCNENAKLIAAAPDLLEACKSMIEALNNAPSEWIMTNDVMQCESIMIDAVNRAVHQHHS